MLKTKKITFFPLIRAVAKSASMLLSMNFLFISFFAHCMDNKAFSPLSEYKLPKKRLSNASLSKDGRRIAFASKAVIVFDMQINKEVFKKECFHNFYIETVRLSSNGAYIAYAISEKKNFTDSPVTVYEVKTKQEIYDNNGVFDFSLSKDKVALNRFKDIGFFSLQKPKEEKTIFTGREISHCQDIVLSANGNCVAFVSEEPDSRIYVYDLINKKEIFAYQSPKLLGMTLSLDGKHLALFHLPADIVIFDIKKEKRVCKKVKHYVNCLALSADGRYVACGFENGEVVIFDGKKKKNVCRYSHGCRVLDVCFTNDGKKVLSVSGNGLVKVYKTSKTFRIAQKNYQAEKSTKKERLEFLRKKNPLSSSGLRISNIFSVISGRRN